MKFREGNCVISSVLFFNLVVSVEHHFVGVLDGGYLMCDLSYILFLVLIFTSRLAKHARACLWLCVITGNCTSVAVTTVTVSHTVSFVTVNDGQLRLMRS